MVTELEGGGGQSNSRAETPQGRAPRKDKIKVIIFKPLIMRMKKKGKEGVGGGGG